MSVKRIEIMTSETKFGHFKKEMGKLGVTGMTVMQIMGCGTQFGTQEYEAETNVEMELLPKQLIMLLVKEELLDKAIDVIKKELYTGHIGDGKIVVSDVTNIIRVRTGEEGVDAL